MVNLLQQEFLLLHLRLERPFGLFKLAALVEVAKFLELGEQTGAHVTASGFRILQQQTRELLVDAEEFARVFFEKEFRMKHRPVMGGADEGEQAQQVLEAIAAQSLIQGASGPLRTRRFHEHKSRGGDEPVLGLGLRGGPILDSRERIQPAENDVEVALPGRRWISEA